MMLLFLFILIFYSTYNHSITFIQNIHPSPFAEDPLHLLIAGQLSGKNLPGVLSQDLNSGLPYSKNKQIYSRTGLHSFCDRLEEEYSCASFYKKVSFSRTLGQLSKGG
jgi:hypothetical protein